ncbi:MAG: rhomboid family intramembrane serine protease [Bacteroidota bacterium]
MSYFSGGGQGRYYRPSMFGGFSFFPPVIKTLLISNVAIWLVFGFFLPLFTLRGVPIFAIFSEYLALWPLGTNFWPWQLITYMFMHGGFGHLFFNMLALWMFGMELEHNWGSRKFLLFYLLCGIGAGIANLLVAPLLGQAAPTVGASGAVFGVLIAFGMLYPDRPIYLYFLLPVKAKYFIAAYIGIELFYGVTGTSDGIAHVAHLGGAAVGFLFILVEKDLLPGRAWLDTISRRRAAKRAPQWDGKHEVQDARFYDIKSGRSDDDETEVTQEKIDEILDKISREGYQSLTPEEKRILNEASKKIH